VKLYVRDGAGIRVKITTARTDAKKSEKELFSKMKRGKMPERRTASKWPSTL